MKVVLIPCATTEWQDEGRLLGRVELSPTSAGENQCAAWAEQLRMRRLQRIYHSPDELALRTAQLVARKLLLPTKAVRNLAEVDVGLWAGLTEGDLESRYESAYRELCESPLNVSPPEGENLGEAEARLEAFLRKRARRNDEGTVGLVLRPISFAMVWCMLEKREPASIWETAKRVREPVIIDAEVDPKERR